MKPLFSLALLAAAALCSECLWAREGDVVKPDHPALGAAESIVESLQDSDLRRLATDVLERNPRLAMLSARARSTDQRAPQVRSLPDPMASLTLFLLQPQTRVGPQQASASISQRLPWFGKLKLKEQAALLDAAAAWTRVEALRLELVTKVRSLYLELQYLDREEKIVIEDQTTLGHYEELARARYSSGVGIAQAVIKIQAEITRARTRLLDLQERRVALITEINALRDRTEGTPVPVGAESPEIEALPSFDRIRESAIKTRPELAEAQAVIDAATTRVELSKKDYRPDFTVGLNYALVGKRDDRAGRLNPPEGNGDDILGVSGGINLPIWRKKLAAGVEEAVQQRLAAEQSRRALVTEIDGDLADLARRIPLIREQLGLFDRILTAQATESLRSAESAYASGTASALDLLDAERVLLGVRIAAARVRTDLAIAAATLEGVLAAPPQDNRPERKCVMTTNDHQNDSSTSPSTRKKGLPSLVKSSALVVLGGLIVVAAAFLTGVYPPPESDHASDSAAQGGDQLWTCGMHPEVIQEEPGICPICHMDLTPLRDSGQDMTEEHADQHEQAGNLWTCGMHPQVVEEQPGQCPICGMDLVPLHNGDTAAKATQGERKILFYRSPMDSNVTSPVPRKDEMGMEYVPVYSDEAESAAKQGATVTIDPAVVQNMNVTTEMVARHDVTRQIRTVGYLDFDQERMVSITTKYAGFIEKVYVNYVGEPVKAGQPLFEIYSPELVQTQQELLSVLRYARQMAETDEETRRRAESLLESAHERLRYWDITEEQIAELERTNKVIRTLKVYAPSSGVVMQRMPGLEGMAARPGMELLHIADMRNLWLTVEVFEDQLPWVNVGSQATVTLTYFPGKSIRGKVRFIEPEVSEKTRSLQLTLDIPNHDARLRVGMYATVLFEPVAAHNALTVPSNAILRTGTRNVAIVALGEGRFAPREVQLGPAGEGFVQVTEGLEEGDEIVTSAQFLIDSESNLREAIQKMVAARRAQASAGGENQPSPKSKN